MKKKLLSLTLVLTLTAALFAACGGGGATANEAAPATSETVSTEATPAGATPMELWTFQELHVQFYQAMEQKWNEANPDRAIEFTYSPLPYDDMHNKLLVALQSGVGAPDIVDIEIGKFANFLRGEPQLVPINKVVEPELDNIVRSRVDIYSKDGNFYGICNHVGAAVMYYNVELLEAAGIDYTTITTWDQYYEAGKAFKAAHPDKAWSTMEISDPWHLWPLISSAGGDLLKEDLSPNVNSSQMIQALTFNQKLLNEGISIVTPGNNQHSEEFYGMCNGGGVATLIMPMWYMGRFTDYMPDLAGKIAIAPLPVWEAGQPRSVGLGGTGTVVTKQAENPELAVDWLGFAKISREGNTAIWQVMGQDPIRTETWSMPELHDDASNKYISYFTTNPFDVLNEIKDEIPAIRVADALPPTMDALKNSVLYRAYEEKADLAVMLPEEEAKIQY